VCSSCVCVRELEDMIEAQATGTNITWKSYDSVVKVFLLRYSVFGMVEGTHN
jgi:hypothetical protein